LEGDIFMPRIPREKTPESIFHVMCRSIPEVWESATLIRYQISLDGAEHPYYLIGEVLSLDM
jgi:hypothetical protein